MKLKYQILILIGVFGTLFLIFYDQIIVFFTVSTATINLISLIGTIVTIGSFIYALYERDMRQKLEEKRRSQLWSTIDRARYTIFDHVLIKEIEDELSHKDKHRLWLTHQAASDLYISLVEQYLSTIKLFTYKDLENLCLNQVIFWKWQERQWRILISQRPENKNITPPEYFTKIELSPFEQQKRKMINEGQNKVTNDQPS